MGSPAISDAHWARASAITSAATCGLSAASAGAPVISSNARVPTAAPRDQFVMFMAMSFASRNSSEGIRGGGTMIGPLGPPSDKRSAYYGRESNEAGGAGEAEAVEHLEEADRLA